MRQIGEKFKFKNVTLEVTQSYDDSCDNCYFGSLPCRCIGLVDEDEYDLNCSQFYREDNKFVLYKLIPFKFGK